MVFGFTQHWWLRQESIFNVFLFSHDARPGQVYGRSGWVKLDATKGCYYVFSWNGWAFIVDGVVEAL